MGATRETSVLFYAALAVTIVLSQVSASTAQQKNSLITMHRRAYDLNGSRALDIQRYFQLDIGSNKGWLGSDVITSIVLPDSDMVVWLWGDTLRGSLYQDSEGHWKRNFTSMPRNAVATQRFEKRAEGGGGVALSPLAWAIRFNSSTPDHSGFFEPTNITRWYWPTVGFVYHETLYALAYDSYSTKASSAQRRSTSDLSFGFTGSVLLRVTGQGNASLSKTPPLQWRYSRTPLQGTGNTLQWNSAAVIDGDYVYIFGASSTATVLSRIALTSLDKSDLLMEYYADIGEWTSNQSAPLFEVFTERISETSVVWNEEWQCYYALNIRFQQYEMLISTSKQLTGPWSSWSKLYDVPPPWNNATLGVFDYAPKSHPELASSGELIVSYASNTLGLDPLIEFPAIYTPQFARITFTPLKPLS